MKSYFPEYIYFLSSIVARNILGRITTIWNLFKSVDSVVFESESKINITSKSITYSL